MEKREKLRFYKLLKAAADWNIRTVIHAEAILGQRGHSVQVDPKALMALAEAALHCVGKDSPRVFILMAEASLWRIVCR